MSSCLLTEGQTSTLAEEMKLFLFSPVIPCLLRPLPDLIDPQHIPLPCAFRNRPISSFFACVLLQNQELHLSNLTTGARCVTKRTWVRVAVTPVDQESVLQEMNLQP